MTSPEEFTNDMERAQELIDGALAVGPDELADFQKEFRDDNKRRLVSVKAAERALARDYPGLRTKDLDTYISFIGITSIQEHTLLTEMVTEGTMYGNAITSQQSLAYYRLAADNAFSKRKGE